MSVTDVSTDDLVARFTDPTGFKKYIGFLGGKLAQRAYNVYSGADERGAARSYLLDQREHDGTHYHLRAISVRGDLDEATLARLTRAVTLLPLGTVRYEGMMAATLPDAVGSTADAADVQALSEFERGIIVYPVTELSKKGASTYALWARRGDEWFIYPLEDKKL